jgi:hypothetical protein
MAWSDPKTWTADVMLTASDLNQYVSDNLSALYALVQGGGRKNLLQNGAMQVHQRGASVTGITASGYYTADRWYGAINTIGIWTQSVENDAPTGSGFRKSLKMRITANSDATIDAADYVRILQYVEGQNLQSVLKGTASAQQLTVSFWVKSNKTGTYVVELYDVDNTRHVAATYTVVSSATWEQHTVTFPADLTGAFDNDNESSLALLFHLADGSDSTSGTLATTWAASTTANRGVGQTNLAASVNNYWQITGVQLEVGSASTGHEFKDLGTELAECQRYYYHHVSANGQLVGMGFYDSATSMYVNVQFPVTMRATPVPAVSSGTDYFYARVGGSSDLFNTFDTYFNVSPTSVTLYATAATNASGTANYPCIVTAYNAASSVAFSADL